MKKLTLFIILAMSINIVNAQLSTNKYHVRDKVTVTNVDNQLTKLVILLPLAETNPYQTVSSVNLQGGTVADIPETDDEYVRWTYTSGLPSAGQSLDTYYDFDVTLNPVHFNFSQITTIYPYNTSSDTYIWYTGARDVYIDPYNSTIQSIGVGIWTQSSDIVDYARRCYEYVAAHYTYMNPNTGLHPLQQILDDGGGDCANLSSLYVSLLRYKNIPSRHIVTIKPNGDDHVWTDFYLENYGWIPEDVSYKNADPAGDYFGIYSGNCIVLTKEVWLYLDRGDGFTFNLPFFQTYYWWYWYSSGGNNISISQTFSATPFSGIQDIGNDSGITIYPNPATDKIKIENLVLNKTSEAILFIYDLQGQLVLQQPIQQEKPVVDVSSMKKGVYFLQIRDEKKTFTKKLVIG